MGRIIDFASTKRFFQVERIAAWLAKEWFEEPWPPARPAMARACRKKAAEMVRAANQTITAPTTSFAVSGHQNEPEGHSNGTC